jgi:hypothetical protein
MISVMGLWFDAAPGAFQPGRRQSRPDAAEKLRGMGRANAVQDTRFEYKNLL